jgi:hypothetical protein
MQTSIKSKLLSVTSWPFGIQKVIRFEFWPYWILYLPVCCYYLWLSLKARSFSFFTAANPGIFMGGFTRASKYSILSKIDNNYLPTTLLIKEDTTIDNALAIMRQSSLEYPIIVKPDIGERGKGVEKIDTKEQLVQYLLHSKGDLIIQEYISDWIELGVLFYQMPDGSDRGITSVVRKEFLTITGNGQLTIGEWINRMERAQLQKSYLLHKYRNRLEQIIPNEEKFILEPIGNHCRGTTFLNGNHLINDQLVSVFNRIAKPIDGFFIGRFDLKVRSINDLYQGEHIRILELNGVASEPAHIYDPQARLIDAYKALFSQYSLFYTIANQNKQLGVKYVPIKMLLNEIRLHYKQRKNFSSSFL